MKRNIDMPLIGSANLITPDHMRVMVEEAGANFAGVCRFSLDDPEFPNKIIEKREHEIHKSTHTGASLLQGNIFGKGWAGSAQNPTFGRDDEYRLRTVAESAPHHGRWWRLRWHGIAQGAGFLNNVTS